MPNDSDRDLVLRCQRAGSEEFEEAFGVLYRKYKDRVFSLAYRVTGNSNDALDAAQEAFVLLYQNISSFQFDSKFSSWLYRLVTNASIDHLRRSRSRRRPPTLRLEAGPTAEAHALADTSVPDPRKALENEEWASQIHASIQKLSPKLRVITVLRYQQNLSYEELAETLEISLGTVKSRLARAHVALAELLRPLVRGEERSP